MKKSAALTLGVLVLDQATKALLRAPVPFGHEIPLFPLFSIVHVQNTGAAFGILPQTNALFVGVTLVILAVLVKLGKELASQGPWSRAALPLVWGGALGNLMDRLWQGAVTDFLDFHLGGWHWPAFNIADAAICTGVGIYIISAFWVAQHPLNEGRGASGASGSSAPSEPRPPA